MRPHLLDEAKATVDAVGEWQERFLAAVGRRVVWASDEYYLLAEATLPAAEVYEGFPQHENGVGMVRAFELDFEAPVDAVAPVPAQPPERPGFFAWVEGAPAEGYRAPRTTSVALSPTRRRPERGPATVLTGGYGATVLRPILDRNGHRDVRVLEVPNEFFGGNIAVAGLITGADLGRVLEAEPAEGRYLLPDVCLSNGRFLDGVEVADLPRPVEIVATDGRSLRLALAAA